MGYSQYLKQDKVYKFSQEFDKLQKLPSGTYRLKRDAWGVLFASEVNLKTDSIIEMDGSPSKEINKGVHDFLNEDIKAAFDRYDLMYKRGILLYGPPGTGKTCVVRLVIRTAIKNNMVVFVNSTPYDIGEAIENIREIEKSDRPVLVVWEEFEAMLEDDEEGLLDMLDGVDQMPNTFYIATTNYIKRIPSRIRNRPSRFAEVIEIGSPNADLRRAYLEAKIHKDDEVNIDEWVEKTEGFVLDHLKDLIISVLVLKVSLDDAIDKLRILQKEDQEGYDKEDERVLNKLSGKTASTLGESCVPDSCEG